MLPVRGPGTPADVPDVAVHDVNDAENAADTGGGHRSRWGTNASLVRVSANPRVGSSAAGVAADAATTHDLRLAERGTCGICRSTMTG